MKLSYRSAFLIFLTFQFFFFAPVIFGKQVIFPHDNSYEVGITDADDHFPNNRKFSDESRAYIPNLYQHLNDTKRRWLSTWDTSIQLGRPLGQLSGLSRAYLVTNLLSFLVDDVYRLFSIQVFLAVMFGGVFLFLFLKQISCSPQASLFAAVSFANGIFLTYWQTFPMISWLFCWAMGALFFSYSFIIHIF